MTFYVLRYIDGVHIDRRKHAATVGRHPTWLDAEEKRQTAPNPEDLEVVAREDVAR